LSGYSFDRQGLDYFLGSNLLLIWALDDQAS